MADLDFPGILRELTEAGVDFFLIGGIAVGYHGYVRATKDVDIVPSPEASNLDRLATALSRLDAAVDGSDEFSPDELPDPLDPAALATGGIEDEIAGMSIKVVDYKNLVRLKELAGRPEDLADLERLGEARGE